MSAIRTWTLSGARWDDATVIDGPRLDSTTCKVLEAVPVLDLLERAYGPMQELSI